MPLDPSCLRRRAPGGRTRDSKALAAVFFLLAPLIGLDAQSIGKLTYTKASIGDWIAA